jgi:hypothetical protein
MHHTTALIARRHAARSHTTGRALPVLVQRMAIGLIGASLIAAAAWALSRLSHDTPAPKRQVARIAVLPDTPPPPPPPPPKEQKPEASKEARPQPKTDPTPQPPAANEPIIDSEVFNLNYSTAASSDGDGSNRHEIAVARCAARKARAGHSTAQDGPDLRADCGADRAEPHWRVQHLQAPRSGWARRPCAMHPAGVRPATAGCLTQAQEADGAKAHH